MASDQGKGDQIRASQARLQNMPSDVQAKSGVVVLDALKRAVDALSRAYEAAGWAESVLESVGQPDLEGLGVSRSALVGVITGFDQIEPEIRASFTELSDLVLAATVEDEVFPGVQHGLLEALEGYSRRFLVMHESILLDHLLTLDIPKSRQAAHGVLSCLGGATVVAASTLYEMWKIVYDWDARWVAQELSPLWNMEDPLSFERPSQDEAVPATQAAQFEDAGATAIPPEQLAEVVADARTAAVTDIGRKLVALAEAEAALDSAVHLARSLGTSWREIGEVVGIRPESALRRFDKEARRKHTEARRKRDQGGDN